MLKVKFYKIKGKHWFTYNSTILLTALTCIIYLEFGTNNEGFEFSELFNKWEWLELASGGEISEWG